MTLEQELALAVLKGDMTAARALADRIIEVDTTPLETMEALKESRRVPGLGMEVYHWPEFLALCKRLGVAWQLPTTSIVLTIREGEAVGVYHEYRASIRRDT